MRLILFRETLHLHSRSKVFAKTEKNYFGKKLTRLPTSLVYGLLRKRTKFQKIFLVVESIWMTTFSQGSFARLYIYVWCLAIQNSLAFHRS